MQLIAAADPQWGIGKSGSLLHRIPEDMAFFKAMTLGKTVIMGHATLLSLPNGLPLPGRQNIVFSRDASLQLPGAQLCTSLEHLAALLQHTPAEQQMVIGGGSIYRLLLPHCHTAHVTRFRGTQEIQADCFLPNLDSLPEWALTARSAQRQCPGFSFYFATYQNRHPLPLPAG